MFQKVKIANKKVYVCWIKIVFYYDLNINEKGEPYNNNGTEYDGHIILEKDFATYYLNPPEIHLLYQWNTIHNNADFYIDYFESFNFAPMIEKFYFDTYKIEGINDGHKGNSDESDESDETEKMFYFSLCVSSQLSH